MFLFWGLVDRIICRAYLIAKGSEVKTDKLLFSPALQIVGSLHKEFSIIMANQVLPVSGFFLPSAKMCI